MSTSDETPAERRPEYAIPAHVLHRRIDGEMVLLDLQSEQYYGLDDVGADMVSRVTAAPMDDALASLQADYDVEPDVLRNDLEELLTSLRAAGLLNRPEG